MRQLDIKEVQAVSFNILKTIAEISEKETITYVLAYGTLIGAIRHKGYIPWDDDVDIMMPRPDYERFIEYFGNHAAEYEHLRIMNMQNTKRYPHMITRLCDTRYVLDVTNEKPCGLGIFVDIYVLDGCGKTREEGIEWMNKTKKYPSLIFLSGRRYLHKGNTESVLKLLIKPLVFVYAKMMGQKYFVDKLMSLIDTTNYDTSDYVACLVWQRTPRYDVMEKSMIENRVLVEFEGSRFYAPSKYDELLKRIYGDYMTPPPPEKRKYHHMYKAYKK